MPLLKHHWGGKERRLWAQDVPRPVSGDSLMVCTQHGTDNDPGGA